MVNLYISYTLDTCSKDLNTDFTLGNCWLGAVKLIKNVVPDKHGHIGYGKGLDAHSQFSLPDECFISWFTKKCLLNYKCLQNSKLWWIINL